MLIFELHGRFSTFQLQPCTNAILFSAQRSGSTWMIDNLENCRYTQITPEGKKFRGDTFIRTELWHQFGNPEIHSKNVSVSDALRYIVLNSSVKIFPSVWNRSRDDVVSLVRAQNQSQLTILVLRRDHLAVIKSYQNIGKTMWNGLYPTNYFTQEENETSDGRQLDDDAPGPRSAPDRPVHPQIQKIVGDYSTFERDVEEFLGKEDGVRYDVLNYEDVRYEPAIMLDGNRCVIRNCNYNNSEYEKAVRRLRWSTSFKHWFFHEHRYDH